MIRPGTADDLKQIIPFDPFGGSRQVEVDSQNIYVEERDGAVAGYISLDPTDFHGYPYITFLCIRSDFRRQGIATLLISHIESLSRGRRLFISAESDNDAMLKLLAKMNYLHSGALGGLNDDHGSAKEIFFYKDCTQHERP